MRLVIFALIAVVALADPRAADAQRAFEFAAPGGDPGRFLDPGAVRSAVDACLSDARAQGFPIRDCVGEAADACLSYSVNETTQGTIACQSAEAEVWDDILNEAYQDARARGDEGVRTALQDVQRNWIAYRDSRCAIWYEVFRGGTLAGQIAAGCHLAETGRRATELLDLSTSFGF